MPDELISPHGGHLVDRVATGAEAASLAEAAKSLPKLALGMRPINILGQIIVESLLLLAIGLAIGTALSWACVQPMKGGIDISYIGEGLEMWGMSTVLSPELLLKDIVLANVVVLVLGFLASLSPAWRASQYEPIEAITKV